MLMYQCELFIWFGYVDSKSNWSDGIFKNGLCDDSVLRDYSDQYEDVVPCWPWLGTIMDCWMQAQRFSRSH